MRDLTLVKTIRDSLQTLLLHHQLTEKVRVFFKSIRLGDYDKTKATMSAVWKSVDTAKLRGVICNDLPLLPASGATTFGLTMDDGVMAALDVYLYFNGGHWHPCTVTMVEEGGQWWINTVSLSREDWSPEKIQESTSGVRNGGETTRVSG